MKYSRMVNVGTAKMCFSRIRRMVSFGDLIGVIDGCDARARRVERTGLSSGMNRDALAHASGFVHRGGQLGFAELIRRGEDAAAHRIGAGLVDFREVGAQLVLFAHHCDQLVRIIGPGGVGQNVLLGIVADGVFVAAENIDGIAANAQARARNEALIDRVAHGGVGGARAFGSHVALGREAGHQIGTRGERGSDGALRDGFLDGLQILGAGMQEQVHMGVDQAGK